MSREIAQLAGKRAIITGASSGVGKATAELFVAEGARVRLMARRADRWRGIAAGLGERAMALPADVADDKAVTGAVEACIRKNGSIDIAVNSAGIDGPSRLEDLTPEVWRRQLDV